MSKTGTEHTCVVTVTVSCKRCHATFNKALPKRFIEACDQTGAEGFTGTCPRCAAADPIFSALHPRF